MHNKRVSFEQFFHFIKTFDLQNLIDMWEIRDINTQADINIIVDKLDNLTSLLSMINSFIVVIDMSTAEMLYVSPNIHQIIGYNPEEYSIPLLMKIFCTADAKTNTTFVKKINNHQRTVETDKWLYQYVTNYRVYHKERYYVWLESRMIFLGYHQNGKPTLTFAITTKTDHIKSNDYLSYTQLKLDPATLKYNIEEYIEYPPEGIELFDKTGLAIVKGLINGLDNREIAKNLGISEHTLSDYRKRLLKKTWCENTCELVHFAIRNKLV
jgi:DNA-binding CsgD family transcriptional regulator